MPCGRTVGLPSMKLAAKSTPARAEPDFHAEVDGVHLLLPKKLVDALAVIPIRTAEDLLSQTYAFPTSVAMALGWKLDDLKRARKHLARTLKGHVHDDL